LLQSPPNIGAPLLDIRGSALGKRRSCAGPAQLLPGGETLLLDARLSALSDSLGDPVLDLL